MIWGYPHDSGNLQKCWTAPGMGTSSPGQDRRNQSAWQEKPWLTWSIYQSLNQPLIYWPLIYWHIDLLTFDMTIDFRQMVWYGSQNHQKSTWRKCWWIWELPTNMWTWKTVLTIFKSSVGLGSTKTKPRWTDLWLCYIWRFPCGTKRKSSMFIQCEAPVR